MNTLRILGATIALALGAVGCGGSGAVDAGTDSGMDSGMDAGDPTPIADSIEANQAAAAAACVCLTEGEEFFTPKVCTMAFDLFYDVPDEFIFTSLSTEELDCLETATANTGAEYAVECRTELMNDFEDCIDAVVECFLEDVSECFDAAIAATEACPEMPASWEDQAASCLDATIAEDVDAIVNALSTQCQCTICGPEGDIDETEEACMVAYLEEAVMDTETGAELQATLDCMGDVAARTVACFEGISECGEAHTECATLFGGGVEQGCGSGSFDSLEPAATECLD